MDYRKSALEVLENIGGSDNIVSAAHCATRLRLVIADNAKCSKAPFINFDCIIHFIFSKCFVLCVTNVIL